MLQERPFPINDELMKIGRRYFKSNADAKQVAEQALEMISSDPWCIDGGDIRKSLAVIVLRLAQDRLSSR